MKGETFGILEYDIAQRDVDYKNIAFYLRNKGYRVGWELNVTKANDGIVSFITEVYVYHLTLPVYLEAQNIKRIIVDVFYDFEVEVKPVSSQQKIVIKIR